MNGGSGGTSGMTGDSIPKGYSTGELQQFDPKMMDLFKQLFSMFGDESFLSRLAGGDEEIFGEMEKPEWKKLQEQQGKLSSEFSGIQGGMSARRGSGFKNMASQQSSDFANKLQMQRQQMQQMAIAGLMGGTNSLLSQKPSEKFLVENPQ